MRKKLNHRIRYSEKDYIQKNYIKDGKAVIPIKVKKLDDLYMKHDYLKLDLSDEVSDYIEEIAYLIPRKYDIVLEIHYQDEISNNQQDRIRKVFKSNYGSDIDDIDYDLRMYTYRALLYFLFGTFLIFISYIFNILSSTIAGFVAEFFVISGWVFIWNMVEIFSIKRSKLMSRRINKLQLYDSQITFVFDN